MVPFGVVYSKYLRSTGTSHSYLRVVSSGYLHAVEAGRVLRSFLLDLFLLHATDIATLLEIFDRTQPQLLEGIEYLEQHPTEDGKLEGTIAFLNFHESYHCGQLAILRRMLGKESIIK